MKLQKLVYFYVIWFTQLDSTVWFSEWIKFNLYGPYFESIWNYYNKYKNKIITKKMKEDNQYEIKLYSSILPTIEVFNVKYEKLNDEKTRTKDKNILIKIWEVYGNLSDVELINLSLRDKNPWDEYNKNYNLPDYSSGLINLIKSE